MHDCLRMLTSVRSELNTASPKDILTSVTPKAARASRPGGGGGGVWECSTTHPLKIWVGVPYLLGTFCLPFNIPQAGYLAHCRWIPTPKKAATQPPSRLATQPPSHPAIYPVTSLVRCNSPASAPCVPARRCWDLGLIETATASGLFALSPRTTYASKEGAPL